MSQKTQADPEHPADYVEKCRDCGCMVCASEGYMHKALTQEIAKLKEKRQIIIVTHFANLPVCADADLILHCEGNGAVSEGIFSDHIQYFKDMEGGTEAIKQRINRYNMEKI